VELYIKVPFENKNPSYQKLKPTYNLFKKITTIIILAEIITANRNYY
jgi:hypothetical protein